MNRRQFYAFGEPLGDCVTRKEAGRLICGGGGGGTSTTSPYVPQEFKPLARLYTQQATGIANTPWQGYSGQRYANLTTNQRQAIDMASQRALEGSPVMDAANNTLIDTLQGGNGNPYLDQMVGRAQKSVADNFNTMTKPQLESAMVRSGSFGNSGMQQMMEKQQQAAADQMTGIATQMYGNAYNTDRANQMQALGMAPTYGNQAYQDAGQLMNVGNLEQQQAQNNMDFGYQQFQERQNHPYKQLQATGSVLGQNMGTKTSGGGK